ncbi:diguanylate cyclase domain-containing protein [Rhodopila sp.]|uniref:diguanylate cyclase domain-containing protein n=1 Tax=Rhodopila sp. TaxID=2480087 RepID=UPI003D0EFA6F
MAHHDALTDLPNRSLFGERLERTLGRLRGESCLEDSRPDPAEQDWLIAVLFLDLDNFKNVNDALGHAAGDELLRQAAMRIGRCLRSQDTLARLGGDEFAVLLEGLTTVEQAADVGQRVVVALSVPFMLNGNSANVGISVGIALCTRDMDADSAVLLRQADHALYDAKAQGRGTYCFFDNGIDVLPDRARAPGKKIQTYQEERGLVEHRSGSGVSAEFLQASSLLKA